MSKQESAKLQSCVLKVDIQCHCDGCKKKVKKLLQNVDGVYTTNIDADQGKVTVTGDVNPATLIKKLSKSGKHAELWGSQKGKNNFQHQFNDPFKNFQIDAQKNGKDNKSQKGPAQQKGKGGGGGGGQVQQMQQQKGPKEMMKQQKSVKFDMNHEEFDASEDDFGDESDEFDDEFDEDDEDDHFRHQVPKGHQQVPNKMAPMGMMGNGNGLHGHPTMMNMINSQAKGGGGGGGKKGGAIDMPVSMKSGGGKNESKHGNNGVGKKGGGGDGGKKGKGGNDKKQGGKDKNGGIMGFFGFGKKSKNGGGGKDNADKSSTGNGRVGGGGENKSGGGGKQGKGKGTDGVQDMKKMKNEFEIDVTKPGKGPKGGGDHGGGNGSKSMGQMMGPMGSMGPMDGHMGPMGGQMGNYGQMGLTPAVQGLPAGAGAGGSMNGGYYHGMGGGGPGNPYMPVMMNQQHPNMSDMYQYQMMHGRPNQAMNYMPPPPMPPHPSVRDPYTHYFSDENTDGGCSIM